MSTQYIDGSFSETEPLEEAMETFADALQSGIAKAFHVGSPLDIQQVKDQKSTDDRLSDMEDTLKRLKAKSESLIAVPTPAQIKAIA